MIYGSLKSQREFVENLIIKKWIVCVCVCAHGAATIDCFGLTSKPRGGLEFPLPGGSRMRKDRDSCSA